MLLDNLVRTLVEGFYVTRWLFKVAIPKTVYYMQVVFAYIYGLSSMSIAVIVTGWKMVAEKTADNRISYEIEQKLITLDQEAKRRKSIMWDQHLYIVLGFAVNIFIIWVMIYGVNQIFSR